MQNYEPEATYCLHKFIMWRILLMGWFVINMAFNLHEISEGKGDDSDDIVTGNDTGPSRILDSYKYLTNWSELLTVFYCCYTFFYCCYSKCNLAYGTDFWNQGGHRSVRQSSLWIFSDELQKVASNVALLVTVLYYSVDSPRWDYIFVNKHLISSMMLTLDQIVVSYRRINFVGFNFRLLTNNNAHEDEEALLDGSAGAASDESGAATSGAAAASGEAAAVAPAGPYTGSRPSLQLGGLTMTLTAPGLTLRQYYGTWLFLLAYAITNMTISLRTQKPVYPFLDWNANFGQCVGMVLAVGLLGVPFANLYYYLVYFASREAQCCSGQLDVMEYRRLLREEM